MLVLIQRNQVKELTLIINILQNIILQQLSMIVIKLFEQNLHLNLSFLMLYQFIHQLISQLHKAFIHLIY